MKTFTIYFSLLLSALMLVSCSDDSIVDNDDDDGDEKEVTSKYVVAASPTALEDVADYLLTADSLSGGSVSTLGDGIEQDGTYRYYVTDHDHEKFFSFLYSSSGAVTTYSLDSEGELQEIADFQSSIVHAFAPVDDDILSIQIPRSGEPNAHWFRLDTETTQFVAEGQIDTQQLAGNGEWAYFSWLTQVGDYVFAPYFTIRACCNDTFGTQYPDSSWVAVFNYPEMELQTVIKDNRTSFIGKYYTNGLSVDENGDAYGFSAALADMNNKFTANNPSGVLRINSGEMEFDPNYFFNLEQTSGGYYVTNHVYASNGNVVVFMGGPEKTSPYAVGTRLAVVNLYDQSFTWVEGLPDPSTITQMMGRNNLASAEGNTVFTGITTEEGSFVYNIDVATATATRGLEVEGGIITAIHRLDVPE